MIYVEHVEEIAAPAAAVWRFIDWPNLELMKPGGFFKGIVYEERKPIKGATRRVMLANGASIEERLEDYDGEGWFLAYRILDAGGMPIADYRGEVRISANGPGSCFVKFCSRCSPVGLSDDEWRQTYKQMQAASASFIREQTTAA